MADPYDARTNIDARTRVMNKLGRYMTSDIEKYLK